MARSRPPRPLALCLAGMLALAAASPAQEAQEIPQEPGDEREFSPRIDAYTYEELAARLALAEAELARRALGPMPPLQGEELRSVEQLHREIASSFYGDLVDRSRFLLLLARAQAPPGPGERPPPPPRLPRPDRDKPARVLAGTAALSFALSFSLWAAMEHLDSVWPDSPTPEAAMRNRELSNACGLTSALLAGAGALVSGVSVSLFLARGR